MLDEGVVQAVQDIDLSMLLGAGWPFWLGGISAYLDRTGVSEAVTGSRFLPKGPRVCGLAPRLSAGLTAANRRPGTLHGEGPGPSSPRRAPADDQVSDHPASELTVDGEPGRARVSQDGGAVQTAGATARTCARQGGREAAARPRGRSGQLIILRPSSRSTVSQDARR